MAKLLRSMLVAGVLLAMYGCAEIEPKPFEPSPGHIETAEKPPGDIPELVQKVPVLLPPAPPVELETYTVVVNEVPVKELLFALARDAKVNVDIDPRIDGVVTINAVDQTLPQILDRIANQVDLRYEYKGDNLLVQPDEPFLRTYKIGYINMTRDTASTVTIATQISSTGGSAEASAAGGGGGNNSTTDVTNTAQNHFWDNLTRNVSAILEQSAGQASGGAVAVTNSVIPSPETGILTVRATHQQHEKIQEYIDLALENANRQVLIQATIVEVDLNEEYQAGIDWSFIDTATGLSLASATLVGAPVPTALSLFNLIYENEEVTGDDPINITVNLLDEFGDVHVLSSPQLMALSNQTAILKVVNNVVYFEVDQEISAGALGAQPVVATNTTPTTIPVGIVMSLTPQISDNDSVILNVRPTISRVNRFVSDPNPSLRFAPDGSPLPANQVIQNLIPEILVREMESLLRLNDGQIAVLGGLIQDTEDNRDSTLPGISKLPVLGDLATSKSKVYKKTELVIFLRPTIIRTPSIEADLDIYKPFLERQPQAPGSVGAPSP